MSMVEQLATLRNVELRTVWPNEARDFTPWLATESSLSLLGQELGIEVELVGTEMEVGRYSADVVCKGVDDDSIVLIENQITESDHIHLGQTLTYAGEFEPAIVVWVASSFTDEHKKSVEWLNSISHDKSDFFAVTIEAWQIGESPPAPKFDVVVHPENWSKQQRRVQPKTELSGLKRIQQEFWGGFVSYVKDNDCGFTTPSALPLNEMLLATGRTNLQFRTWIGRRGAGLHVALYITGPNCKAWYEQLTEYRTAIEDDLDMQGGLEWRAGWNDRAYYVEFNNLEADFNDRSDWPNQHRWLADTLSKFDAVFRPRVTQLTP